MRIGVIGPSGPDYFADNIADCLPSVGAEPVVFGSVRPDTRGRVSRLAVHYLSDQVDGVDRLAQRRLQRRVLDAGCDLVITVSNLLHPSVVAALRAAKVPVVLWFPDHVAQLNDAMQAAPYSRIYVKDPDFAARMNATIPDWPITYMPEACNPHWHRPIGHPAVEPGFIVAGNYYASRTALLNRLAVDGIPMRLYGPGIPRWLPQEMPVRRFPVGPEIRREDKARVFRSASGVLNSMFVAEVGVNARLFEAAGSGAAVITENRPALHELFDVGREVLAFDTYDELLGHCRRLAEDPTLVAELGDAAARRAHAEHTYQVRLTRILEDCAA